MSRIRLAIVGVGNCASSLIQGLHYYQQQDADLLGLMHENIAGYVVGDIEPVIAFDVDPRKVGHNLHDAIFAAPNCTQCFCKPSSETHVIVQMGKCLDGIADHMINYDASQSFRVADAPEPSTDQIVGMLKAAQVDILINYLPVGSQLATEFYVDCALQAGVGVVNCIPVFIASDSAWQQKFIDAGLPIVGDDIKAQLGATILHRQIMKLCQQRGVSVERTYQLNTGGNTDFLNMRNDERIQSKKISKTEAVQSALSEPLKQQEIHVGPSDYVSWQKDNKVAFIRVEGKLFGHVPMNMELRLSVEDSPNSAAVVVDAIRYCKVAIDKGISGPLLGPSAFCCKHPAEQMDETKALQEIDAFLEDLVSV